MEIYKERWKATLRPSIGMSSSHCHLPIYTPKPSPSFCHISHHSSLPASRNTFYFCGGGCWQIGIFFMIAAWLLSLKYLDILEQSYANQACSTYKFIYTFLWRVLHSWQKKPIYPNGHLSKNNYLSLICDLCGNWMFNWKFVDDIQPRHV